MLVEVVPVRMVQMAVMQIVNVALMLDSDMPAIGSVLVIVVGVVRLVARSHGDTPVG